jgi:hypothetical protein
VSLFITIEVPENINILVPTVWALQLVPESKLSLTTFVGILKICGGNLPI